MLRYVASRLWQAVITILLVVTAVFFLVRLSGDPIKLLLPSNASRELEDRMRSILGLDGPLYEQYMTYIGNLLKLDLGTSISTGRPVIDELLRAAPATMSLAVAALLITVIVAVPLGAISALRKGSPIDHAARGIALLGQSLPAFWLALMLILVFAVFLKMFPVAGRGGLDSYVLPAISIAVVPIAGIVRLTRSSMLDVLGSDYLLMARAKGLPGHVMVVKHALRNALIPVLTYGGLLLVTLINGSVVIENVFAWPGLGQLTLRAVMSRDFPIVQAVVIMIVVFYVAVNLLVDLLYVAVDPRIRNR